jgi:uncharacterized protein (DUF1810 family)
VALDLDTRSPAVNDLHNLERFVQAQAGVFEQVCSELRQGRKRSHWMWFVFPQIKGLGNSATAQLYAISSCEEAEAYLQHSLLGPRLLECTRLVTQVEGRSIEEILGFPDNLKFRSSMTLFAHAARDKRIFLEALSKYFGGEFDARTVERL